MPREPSCRGLRCPHWWALPWTSLASPGAGMLPKVLTNWPRTSACLQHSVQTQVGHQHLEAGYKKAKVRKTCTQSAKLGIDMQAQALTPLPPILFQGLVDHQRQRGPRNGRGYTAHHLISTKERKEKQNRKKVNRIINKGQTCRGLKGGATSLGKGSIMKKSSGDALCARRSDRLLREKRYPKHKQLRMGVIGEVWYGKRATN